MVTVDKSTHLRILDLPAIILAIASHQEARICSKRHLAISRQCRERYTERHTYPILWQPSCRVFEVLWERIVHTVDTRNRNVFFAVTDVLQYLAAHLEGLQHL